MTKPAWLRTPNGKNSVQGQFRPRRFDFEGTSGPSSNRKSTGPWIRRSGFTLVELLVVIAIIAILIALLFPAVQAIRSTASRIKCQNNQRQIGIAIQNYASDKERMPPGGQTTPTYHNWPVFLFPYFEQNNVYEIYDFNEHYWHPNNTTAIATPIRLLICPATPHASDRMDVTPGDLELACADYAPPLGVVFTVYAAGHATPVDNAQGAMTFNNDILQTDIRDGLSNTIAIGEDAGRPFFYVRGGKIGPDDNNPGCGNAWVIDGRVAGGGWADWIGGMPLHGFTEDGLSCPGPYGLNVTNNNEAFSFHPAGIVFTFCDGHVTYLSDSTDIEVYSQLVTRDGGEVISDEY